MNDRIPVCDEVIEDIKSDEARRIVHIHYEPPVEPEYGPLVDELDIHPILKERLKKQGILRLYEFQSRAVEKIKNGKSVVITAGTGAGKTEAFLIPILDYILTHKPKHTVALIIYPTKALARDQFRKVEKLIGPLFGFYSAIYDGDTPQKERKRIYEKPPQILITNPDMIHVALQEVPKFRDLVRNVKFIVLDELHTYEGVFGCHVAYIIRRLKRILRDKPILIGLSATIGNPVEHALKLFSEKVEHISTVKGKRGPIYHVMLRPIYRPRLVEALEILSILLKHNLKSIIFADSHRAVELLKRMAVERNIPLEIHRAGLKPEFRVRVEQDFRRGIVKAVAATPTLELGIDIGDLDAVILVNIPPTYSKYLQRVGRCGRRGQKAYVFTVLGEDPISYYYEKYPMEFYNSKPDDVALELHNEEVAKIQIISMSRDRWIKIGELDNFTWKIVKQLIKDGYLTRKGKYIIPTRKAVEYTRKNINLRGMGVTISIFNERGEYLGFREMPMAMRELHPYAIYFLGGEVYESIEFDINSRKAIVRKLPYSIQYYTLALYSGSVNTIDIIESRNTKYNIEVYYANIEITEQVYGYIVKDYKSHETIGENILDEPVNYTFKTKALILRLPQVSEWSFNYMLSAYHAFEHAMIVAAQTIIGASQSDLGGLSYPSGHIIVYDGSIGGSGLSKLLYLNFERVLERMYKMLTQCTCVDGCPRCIYTPYCGNNNRMLSRKGAIEVLRILMGGVRIDVSEEPYGEALA